MIDPIDVYRHPKDYLLDGKTIDTVSFIVGNEKNDLYVTSALPSSWEKRVTKKPQVKKVKMRLFKYVKDCQIYSVTDGGNPDTWLYLLEEQHQYSWIGPIQTMEVPE